MFQHLFLFSTIDFGEKEGSFDGWCLLQAFKKKAEQIGVHYIKGDCQRIDVDVDSKVNGVTVSTIDLKLSLMAIS